MISTRVDAQHHAPGPAREPESAPARVDSPADPLARSLRREEELRGLLMLAHERIGRDDEEFRAQADRFQVELRQVREELRRQSERGDELEARLIGIRRSLPGRLFLTLRAIWSIGRRR